MVTEPVRPLSAKNGKPAFESSFLTTDASIYFASQQEDVRGT